VEQAQIRAFLAVARQGSFSKAAHALFRTQPSVTMSVQALERDLGVRLFERTGRGPQLTEAGQALLDLAGPLAEQWQSLPARFKESQGGELRGPVRVGAGEGPVLYMLPKPIQAFRRRHPKAEVVVMNQSSEQTLAMLKSGELDFGLRSLPSVPQGFDYQPTMKFERVVVAPKGHPITKPSRITLKRLSEFSFVMPWKYSVSRRIIEEKLGKEGLACKVGLEAGGWEVIKRYVAIGLGIAVMPSFCIEPQVKKQLVARPVGHLFGYDTYGIVTRKGKQLSKAAKALVRELAPRVFPMQKEKDMPLEIKGKAGQRW
jgi:DNA-binding transcriptional LysR family regulator